MDTLTNANKKVEIEESNANIIELLSSSDLLLAQESTTMLEAYVISKKSISLDPLGIRNNIPYVTSGISQSAKSYEELENIILNFYNKKISNNFITKDIIDLKPNATHNIVSLIEKILK